MRYLTLYKAQSCDIKFNVPGTVIVWWDGVHVCVGEIKGTTIVQINNHINRIPDLDEHAL